MQHAWGADEMARALETRFTLVWQNLPQKERRIELLCVLKQVCARWTNQRLFFQRARQRTVLKIGSFSRSDAQLSSFRDVNGGGALCGPHRKESPKLADTTPTAHCE